MRLAPVSTSLPRGCGHGWSGGRPGWERTPYSCGTAPDYPEGDHRFRRWACSSGSTGTRSTWYVNCIYKRISSQLIWIVQLPDVLPNKLFEQDAVLILNVGLILTDIQHATLRSDQSVRGAITQEQALLQGALLK